jgi:hypothetical protein
MRRRKQLLLAILAIGLVIPVVSQAAIIAETANVPSLVISQLKITSSNGQFVTLYNNTNNVLDMSRYQLEYFNSYDASKATSSRLISLSGTLPPHSYFMVNDSALTLCYQLTIDSVSLGFSSTTGMVELLSLGQSATAPIAPLLQDYVGWSKTAAAGAQTLPNNTNAFLTRQPLDTDNNPTVISPGAGSWQSVQPDTNQPCGLVSLASGAPVKTGLNQLLPPNEPPATIVSLDPAYNDSASDTTNLPEADIGLIAPQITELLPNPAGTGNDDTAEFIELYNANDTVFDLSDFSLQVGTTTVHKYTLPTETRLPPKSFMAFYSGDTGLSLSNSGSQAKLLDPAGNSLSASQIYGTAKDGQAWALANGTWYWTTTPTPGAPNVINQPLSIKKVASTKIPKTKPASAKAASQPKAKKAAPKKAKKPKKAKILHSASAKAAAPAMTPVHTGVLAGVAGLALLYGAYEYRADLANRIHQFKGYFKNRFRHRV